MNTKITAALSALAAALCLICTGCADGGSPDDNSSGISASASAALTTDPAADTDPAKEEIPLGTMLKNPEATFSLEEIFISVSADFPDSQPIAFSLTLKDTADPGILYVADMTIERVYELSSDGTVVKYEKSVFSESFVQDTQSSAEDLNKEVEGFKEILLLLGYGLTDRQTGIEYKKCEDLLISLTGEAYQYECYVEGKLLSTIGVDKETGGIVKWKDPTGHEQITVTEIRTEGITLPDYK